MKHSVIARLSRPAVFSAFWKHAKENSVEQDIDTLITQAIERDDFIAGIEDGGLEPFLNTSIVVTG